MKKVRFYNFDDPEKPVLRGTWTIEAGVAVCDDADLTKFVGELLPLPHALGPVLPTEAGRFLEALVVNFSGSRLRAEPNED